MTSARLSIKVVPGASSSEIVGWLGDVLKVRVTVPPERGRANAAVERLIAAALGLEYGRVRVVVGPSSPQKIVEITGLSDAEVHSRLGKGA